jgi:predicted RNA-binding Zn-ribbon protein involved in translation (DUF1610 family)
MPNISRVVGEVVGADGARRPLYEALRALICTSCTATIPEGARFTRHAVGGEGEAILPRCAECAPHEQVEAERPTLLEALLRPEEGGSSSSSRA